jgi:hypothetical protein
MTSFLIDLNTGQKLIGYSIIAAPGPRRGKLNFPEAKFLLIFGNFAANKKLGGEREKMAKNKKKNFFP